MKKSIFILLLSVIGASGISAQLTIRPYVGINSNTLTEDIADFADWKTKIGYQLGADLQIGRRFYVQPGFQAEFARNKIESTIPGSEDTEFKRTHLRVPVMVGYAFGKIDGNFAARLFTGPNASIVLAAEVDDQDIKDQLKNAVFGWNVGAGLDISILFIDLGYQIGLSNVFDDLGLDAENGSKGNAFYANAGVRLRF